MSAEAWVKDLIAAIRAYEKSRHSAPPVVRVTLRPSESHYVMNARAGEADELVTLDVYAEDVADLLQVEQPAAGGQTERKLLTRKVLVVHPSAILKFELLDEFPGAKPFGFGTDPDAGAN